MRKLDIPPTAVMPVIGRSYQRVDGSQEISYTDAAGNRFVCVSDGATRQWYVCDPKQATTG